ncbi:MAG: heavy metal-binding domain-containing protein [Pirellulaceae bacterium]
MHPEVEQNGPGACPICGMDLEPKSVDPKGEAENAELHAMTRRLGIAAALTLPVFLLAMLPMMGVPVDRWLDGNLSVWLQLGLSTPVVWVAVLRAGLAFDSDRQSQHVHPDCDRGGGGVSV